jgi:hypothetical protein
MAKKIVSKVRGKFLSKNILFYTPRKKITGHILNKKLGFLIFHTVVVRYSKSFMQKYRQKIDAKSPWQ